MSETIIILALWVGFGGSHMALSSLRLRPRLVARLGEQGFALVYSLVALVFFVALVWYFALHRHAGPELWSIQVTEALRWVLYVGNGLALVILVAGVITPSPASFPDPDVEPRGVQNLTRHPVFMGMALWGLLHLIPGGHASDVAFFAGFPIWVMLGSWHQDRRRLATAGESFRAFCNKAPLLPFTGPHTLRGVREFSPIALVAGIGMAILLAFFHTQLFG